MHAADPSHSSGEDARDWVGRARAAIGDGRRDGARQRTERARAELGRLAFDALEDHFPEQAKERRRRDAATPFVAGIAVGVLLCHLSGQ